MTLTIVSNKQKFCKRCLFCLSIEYLQSRDYRDVEESIGTKESTDLLYYCMIVLSILSLSERQMTLFDVRL